MAHDIFLSYCREDMDLALKIVTELRLRGVDIWYDAMIPGGDDWRDEIVDNLGQSRAMIILFSRHSNDSTQLKKELAVADSLRIKIMPVLVDQVEPKGHYLYELASRQWINMSDAPATRVSELGERIASLMQVVPRAGGTPAEPIFAEAPPAVERVMQSAPPPPSAAKPEAPAQPSPPPPIEQSQVRSPGAAQPHQAQAAQTSAMTAPASLFSAFRPLIDPILVAGFGFAIVVIAMISGEHPPRRFDDFIAVAIFGLGVLMSVVWPMRWAMREVGGGSVWHWKWLRRGALLALCFCAVLAVFAFYTGGELSRVAPVMAIFWIIGFSLSTAVYAISRRIFELRRFRRALSHGAVTGPPQA